jgi:hypothetical protein
VPEVRRGWRIDVDNTSNKLSSFEFHQIVVISSDSYQRYITTPSYPCISRRNQRLRTIQRPSLLITRLLKSREDVHSTGNGSSAPVETILRSLRLDQNSQIRRTRYEAVLVLFQGFRVPLVGLPGCEGGVYQVCELGFHALESSTVGGLLLVSGEEVGG